MQIARFDPADVEHFVDQIEQVTAGADDVTDAGALGLRRILPLEELAKPENGVERRPQFMAHPGEKFALGVIGAVRLFLRLAESFLDPGAVGHVVRHAEHDLVRLRPRSRPKHVDQRSVLPRVTINEVRDLSVHPQDLRDLIRHRPVFGANEVDVRPSHQFGRGITPQLLAGGAHADKAAPLIHRADHVLGVVHDELVGVVRGFQLALAFAQRLFRLLPLGDVFHHDQEVARVPIDVPHQAGGAGDPEDFAILPDISSFHRRARPSGQQLLRILFPLRDIVLERDVHRGALRQLALRISHHLAERRVYLVKAFVEAHHRHANGRILEDLAEALLARLERGGPVRDRAHFPNAAQARDNEKHIFENHPARVLERSQRTGREHAVDGIRPVDSAQEMVERHDDGRGNEHSPIPIERENDQRTEDMEMRFDSSARQRDQQSRHEHLGDGDDVAVDGRAGPNARHPNRKDTDGAAQEDGPPDVDVDLARLALPGQRRDEKRDENSSNPLEEHQPRE